MATTVYSVIGEHRLEPHRLLLLCDDGHYYAFAANAARPTAVEPTEEWEIDPPANRPASLPVGEPDPRNE
jgi:hypothetical protein